MLRLTQLSHHVCDLDTREIAIINLVGSIAIPAQRGCLVNARVCYSKPISDENLLFEHNYKVLESLGVSAIESAVSCDNSSVRVPIHYCALNDSELGCTDILKHSIDTGDSCPIQQQPYRTPVVRWENMAEMIESMQAQLRPCSSLLS